MLLPAPAALKKLYAPLNTSSKQSGLDHFYTNRYSFTSTNTQSGNYRVFFRRSAVRLAE